jgi:hypothetical protein
VLDVVGGGVELADEEARDILEEVRELLVGRRQGLAVSAPCAESGHHQWHKHRDIDREEEEERRHAQGA